jgi:hypothetical protein
MTKDPVAHLWFSVIAALVIFVIPIQCVLSAQNHEGTFTTAPDRVIDVFCYFTIQSNIIVGIASLFFVLKKSTKTFEKVLRLDALVCITVTGAIYHLLLGPKEHLHGFSVYTNQIVHTAVPLLYILGWLLFMPRGNTSVRNIWFAVIFPICWAIFAMIRGALIHYYPYDFMDVRDLGYAKALINMAVITVFFFALFFGAHGLDVLMRKKSVD